jgi:hypothetical protein
MQEIIQRLLSVEVITMVRNQQKNLPSSQLLHFGNGCVVYKCHSSPFQHIFLSMETEIIPSTLMTIRFLS